MFSAADKTLLQEIDAATRHLTTRHARCDFIKQIDNALDDFNRLDVLERFDEYVKKHGRILTAIIIAATIIDRRDRLDGWKIGWAMDVSLAWHNKPVSGGVRRAAIHSDLHPTRICEFASKFIDANTQ